MAANYTQSLAPQPSPLGQILLTGLGAADPNGAQGQAICQMSIPDMMGLRSNMRAAQNFMSHPIARVAMPFSAQLAFGLIANDVNSRTTHHFANAQAFGMNGNVNAPQGLASLPASAFSGSRRGAASNNGMGFGGAGHGGTGTSAGVGATGTGTSAGAGNPGPGW
jgi:hypothetical protein